MIFAIFALRAYIECSAMENRGLRHVVEEAVWILNSAITSTENALMSSFEAIGSTGSDMFRYPKPGFWFFRVLERSVFLPFFPNF